MAPTKLVQVAFLLCVISARPASAAAIYSFSLPENGQVSAVSIELTFVNLLAPGGLIVLAANNPQVTSLSFPEPGFSPATSFIGLQVTPTTTLIGIALQTSSAQLLLLTNSFPADFFSFPRLPGETGTWASTSGNVVSILPLATGSPTGTLTVTTTVPEPTTIGLLVLSVSIASVRRLRRRSAQRR